MILILYNYMSSYDSVENMYYIKDRCNEKAADPSNQTLIDACEDAKTTCKYVDKEIR